METPKTKVAFIEPPEQAVFVLDHCARSAAWDVLLLVTGAQDTAAVRVARKHGIPVRKDPDPALIAACQRVVVGSAPFHMFLALRQFAGNESGKVILLEDFLPEVAAGDAAPTTPLAPPTPSILVAAHEVQAAGEAAATAPLAPPTPPAREVPAPDVMVRARRSMADLVPAELVFEARPAAPTGGQLEPSLGPALTSVAPLAPMTPAEPPAPLPLTSVPRELRFDARTFLGAPIDDRATSLKIDFKDGRTERLLDEARQLADAISVNLMLVEPFGEHLRVVAASGLDSGVASMMRLHIGVGPAGEAFATRKPAVIRSQTFAVGEQDGMPRWRVMASVPITISHQPIGVVTVTFISTSMLRDEEVIARLDRLAHALPFALIGAVDLSDFPRAQQRTALHLLVDRLMSLDEALPGRLSAFAAVLRRAIGARAVRIFMLDTMEGRLAEIASHSGWATLDTVSTASDLEFLNEVMKRGEALAQREDSENGTRIGFPIVSTHARCLMLLEGVPTTDVTPEPVLDLLHDVVGLLEEMINIEQGMVVQEFLSELSMRLADRKVQIDLLPLTERVGAFLELALGLTAAEVALWIPRDGTPPLVIEPGTPETSLVAAWAAEHAAALAAWVAEKGSQAQGVVAVRHDPQAPAGPAPYIGIPSGRGALVLFFDAQVIVQSRQVPSYVHWRILGELVALIPDSPTTAIRRAPRPARGR